MLYLFVLAHYPDVKPLRTFTGNALDSFERSSERIHAFNFKDHTAVIKLTRAMLDHGAEQPVNLLADR